VKVFDASAVLAVLFNEPGADQAVRWLEDDDAVISSVNQAEVLAKLLDKGLSEADVTAIAQQLPLQVVPFSAAQARTAASLRPATRALGLSLGDRCCLALASAQPGAQVVTADRPWAGLAGFDIALIR
jgi:PIN domain nuclease of toxin-antitoxin system